MQIPILNGIFTDEDSDFRTSYPRNLIPVPKQTGISKGYLRPADGIKEFGEGPGVDRGGINWDDECYRVMGSKLVKILDDGTSEIIGDVGNDDDDSQVSMDYSFDYLAVVSVGNAYLYDKATLQQITDPDLGIVYSVIFVDGYFMFTDGEFLIVNDLDDPFSINPLKYGSSEADPDPIWGLVKIRNEPYAINRYTTEVFDNIGGKGFPFQRVEGAQIEKGTVGTHSNCVFMETVALIGSGRNESLAIYMTYNGQAVKISTREIDQILENYTLEELNLAIMEPKTDRGHDHLWIHLPDQVVVYDGLGSKEAGEPIWFKLTTSLTGLGQYRARNLVWCYNKWLVGDPTSEKHGFLSDDTGSQYDQEIGWDFSTPIIYNEGRGIIIYEIELVTLPGRSNLNVCPTVWTSYSIDGETFSQEKPRTAGKIGQREKRITWFKQGKMRNWRLQKFRGTSEAHLSIARLEISVEPLNA